MILPLAQIIAAAEAIRAIVPQGYGMTWEESKEYARVALEAAVRVGKCPFLDPEFNIAVDTPCPICGMTGELEAEDKCLQRGVQCR